MHSSSVLLQSATMGSGAEWAFESYLAYVPYKGVSHKQHKDAVKAAGGFFDWNLKKWVARTETALLSMIATRVWHPDGIARGDVDALVAYVQQRVQKGSVGERERATQQHAREHEKMARQERVREAEQDDKKKLKAAAVAARKRRDLGRPDDEPSLVAHCLDAYGILPGDLSLTAHFPELGPLSGLSDAARVTRAFSIADGYIGKKHCTHARIAAAKRRHAQH